MQKRSTLAAYALRGVGLALIWALAWSLVACAGSRNDAGVETPPPDDSPVVEVVARGLTFEAPSEIPSGWTTFRFRNESEMVHFALVERMPAGRGIEDQQTQVAPLFQAGMDLLSSGETDAAMAKFGEIPEWFGQIVFFGGPGLTSPHHVSEATINLEPGTYLLECYVKVGGIFHSYNPDPATYGMVHEFTVTDSPSGRREPNAAIHVRISADAGIAMSGSPEAGPQTFSVEFVDQVAHENFVGHDVHVARLPAEVDFARLEEWMDWRRPEGLQTPSPVDFIGGLNEMPAGSKGYFTVTLESGDYALISEVPGAREKGLLSTFTVQ